MNDIRKIINFIKKNENFFEDDSLMNGKTSLIFSLAISEKYRDELSSCKFVENLIQSVYTSLSHRTVTSSYCHGLAGIGWALNYLSSKLILPYEFTDLLESIDETLTQQAKHIEINNSFL